MLTLKLSLFGGQLLIFVSIPPVLSQSWRSSQYNSVESLDFDAKGKFFIGGLT